MLEEEEDLDEEGRCFLLTFFFFYFGNPIYVFIFFTFWKIECPFFFLDVFRCSGDNLDVNSLLVLYTANIF